MIFSPIFFPITISYYAVVLFLEVSERTFFSFLRYGQGGGSNETHFTSSQNNRCFPNDHVFSHGPQFDWFVLYWMVSTRTWYRSYLLLGDEAHTLFLV